MAVSITGWGHNKFGTNPNISSEEMFGFVPNLLCPHPVILTAIFRPSIIVIR